MFTTKVYYKRKLYCTDDHKGNIKTTLNYINNQKYNVLSDQRGLGFRVGHILVPRGRAPFGQHHDYTAVKRVGMRWPEVAILGADQKELVLAGA